MLSVTKIASYFCSSFLESFGFAIDEMKLHKLLYLTQREYLVQYNTPVFGDVFEAWKYGPVAPDVRHAYKNGLLNEIISDGELYPYMSVINHVFQTYASRNSWSLSSITHGDYAWQSAYAKAQGHLINVEDMRKDASRIRLRRFLLK